MLDLKLWDKSASEAIKIASLNLAVGAICCCLIVSIGESVVNLVTAFSGAVLAVTVTSLGLNRKDRKKLLKQVDELTELTELEHPKHRES